MGVYTTKALPEAPFIMTVTPQRGRKSSVIINRLVYLFLDTKIPNVMFMYQYVFLNSRQP